MNQLYFITGNKGKLFEIQNKMKSFDIKIIQKDIGYPEIQTETLEEVASYGINHIKQNFLEPFIIEDAGIFIDELNGFPGVYSKYVFYTIGLDKILKIMHDVKNRSAIFKSVYGYCEPNQKPVFFLGECKGQITKEKKGTGGFGYDPIFIPKNSKKTFAEMSIDEKNKYSHRGKALDKLVEFFKKKYDFQ